MLGITPQGNLVNGQLTDGGPIYRETHSESFIVEPFNAVTAVTFLVIALYWANRLKGRFREFRLLMFCLGILAIGGVGGTLYHGLRTSRVFYIMDILPIGLSILILSAYLWTLVSRRWWWALASVSAAMFIEYLAFPHIGRQYAISISYGLLATVILVPIVTLMHQQRYEGTRPMFLAIGFFVLALLFRTIDPYPISFLPMGTHWLWHLFSASSVQLLIVYLVPALERAAKSRTKLNSFEVSATVRAS